MQLSLKAQGTLLGAAVGGTGGAAKLSEALSTVTLYQLGADALPPAVAAASATISNVLWTVAIMCASAVIGRLIAPAPASTTPEDQPK